MSVSMGILGLILIIFVSASLGFLIGSSSDLDTDQDVKTYTLVNMREQEKIEPDPYEVEMVLKVLYMGASVTEKKVLKYLMLKEGIDAG